MSNLNDTASHGDKDQLRQKALSIRANLDMAQISREICKQISAWPVFQKATTILSYRALPHEVSLDSLILDFGEKKWYLPRILPGKTVMFHRYRMGDPLSENTFGIPEPLATAPEWLPEWTDAANLIFVPALMIDKKGGRLGFGQGYYDRFLAGLPAGTPTATPISAKLLADCLPQDSWDVPIGHGITEAEIISLR